MPFVGKLVQCWEPATRLSLKRGPDWRRFAFVRNPYARLYSAYKNKIADLASPYIGVRKAIWRAVGNRQPPAEAPPFKAFVRYAAEQLARSGPGWALALPGGHSLLLDLIDYSFLGRVESFEKDLATVLHSLGAPDEFHDGLDVVVGASARLPAARAYDAALAQLVHEAYRADFFETFRYMRATVGAISA